MDDILAKKNRHLFLEEKDNTHNSFISNINYAVENIDTIKTFNDNVNNGTLQHLLEMFLEQVDSEGNIWAARLTEIGEKILATTSGFNYAAVLTIDQDIEAGATITLPDYMNYRAGTHMLLVSWNGTVCYKDDQYEEIGAFNEKSKVIKIKQELKEGDKLEFRVVALADRTTVADLVGTIPFVSEGSTEARSLAERFGDSVNAKDFGAVGDGETDDTNAILNAIEIADEQGIQTIYLPAGNYIVSLNSDQIARLKGEGVIIHSTGKHIGLTNPGTCDAMELRYFGELYNKRNSSPQAIGIYKSAVDGKTYFFMTTASFNYGDSDNNWAPGRGVFLSKYEFDPDSPMDASAVSLQPTSEMNCDIQPVQYWNILGLGHGGACEPAYINGRLHIFSSVFNGDGYTDILMNADETDIESVTHIQGASDAMAQVAITPDASRIILCTNVSYKQRFSNSTFGQRHFSIYIYDRAEIEASLENVSVSFTIGAKPLTANTPDLFEGNLSPSIAGTGDTVSLLRVKKFSGVKPLTRFTIPAAKAEGGVSGICSDGTYIYFLTSTGVAGYSRTHVMVYTIEGVYIKDINTDFMAGMLGERYLGGAISKDMYHPRSTEIEGIVCWNDQLLFGCKINCRSPEVYVKYDFDLYNENSNNIYYYLDRSFTSEDGYVHVEDETGDDYISCVDENNEVVCYVSTGETAKVFDTDFIEISSWTISGTNVKNASNEVVASFEPDTATGISPDQKPWCPTHKPTDLEPDEYDSTVSYSGTPEHYSQHPNIAHKYIVGVGCRKNTEHAYPLLLDSFVQHKADYTKYGPAVYASRNGDPVWIGTFFERTESFQPFLQITADGSLWLRDILGNLESSSSPEYLQSARIRYDSSEDALRICVSNNYNHGAELKLEGNVSGNSGFSLSVRGGLKALVGSLDGSLVWYGQTIQTSSDERFKQDFSIPSEEVLRAWGDVDWMSFRFIEAVAKKGNAARKHLGLVAQRVAQAFTEHGLNACEYGILCHESCEAVIDNETGEVLSPARDQWTIRYEEALALECIYQRWLGKQRDAKIEALMQRISALENNH